MLNIYLNSFYWEKLNFSKLRIFQFEKLVCSSIFDKLKLTHILFDIKTSCCSLKIRDGRIKYASEFFLLTFHFWETRQIFDRFFGGSMLISENRIFWEQILILSLLHFPVLKLIFPCSKIHIWSRAFIRTWSKG